MDESLRTRTGIDPEAAAAVKAELKPGEKLRWAQRPLPGRYGWQMGRGRIIFGIFFTLVALFISYIWSIVATALGVPWLILLPQLLVFLGLALVFSPLYYRWKAGKMAYAITDQRAITVSGKKGESFDRSQMGKITKQAEDDGSGTLIFSTKADEWIDRTVIVTHGFRATPDVNGAEQAVQRIIANPI